MRILRVLTRLNLGGPARQALASDPLLGTRGHTVRILAGTPQPGEGDLFGAFEDAGLDVVRVPGLRRGVSPAHDVSAFLRLRRAIGSFQPDVVHTHASKAGTLGRYAAPRDGVALVHTFHGTVLEGYFGPALSRRLAALERRLARRTDRILAVSHATADDLIRLEIVGEEKLVVVQPGIDLAPLLAISRPDQRVAGELRTLIGAGPDQVLVGVVGRLAQVKRPDRALDVFDLIRSRYPAVHLVFVGDGSERRHLEHRINALDEDGRRRVHLVGARPDMVSVLTDLDAVLLTSRAEGLPVALIEAAAASLPVVGMDVGGVGELVVHERTGFLGTSVEELGFGLAQLLEKPAERRSMGARARLRVQREHSARRLADRLEAIYQAALGARTAVPALPPGAGGER